MLSVKHWVGSRGGGMGKGDDAPSGNVFGGASGDGSGDHLATRVYLDASVIISLIYVRRL